MNKSQLLNELKSNSFPKNLINAFSKVNREKFIPTYLKPYAYTNQALPIANSSTISQPYTIAFMLNLLELKDNIKILEIGSGSGYVLALINQLSKNSNIYGIDKIKDLVEKSLKLLPKNIKIISADGSKGLEQKAPFDRILSSASFNKQPKHLFKQLKNKGIFVTPIQDSIFQFKKINNKIISKEFPGFVFIPIS